MKRTIIIAILIAVVGITGMSQTLSLDSCKYYALENNLKIKEAQMELKASEQVKKNAFTNYFPTINAGAVAMKANKGLLEIETPEMNLPVYNGNPATLPTATQFAYLPGMNLELLDYTNAAMVTAIQPLYVGGRVRNGNKLASIGEEFSQHQLNLTTEEVLMKTEYLYWTIMSLKEKKKTLQNYEKLLNNLLKDVSVSYEAGLIQKSDLLKVQLELNKVNANMLKVDNGLSLLQMSLAQHIGIEYSEDMSIADTVIQVVAPETIYNNPGQALVNRNEYQMLNKAVDAELLQKKMAVGEIMPSVAVGVQGLYLDVLEQQNSYGLVFATVSVPISGWWGGSHKIKEHQIKVDIAQNNLKEKSELLMLQMDKTYKNLLESYEQIKVSESSEQHASEHFAVVKDNFEAGVVSTSDLLEAQAIQQQSMDAVVDAKTTYKIKQAEYLMSVANF
jgi:outer membrane protein